MKKSNNTISDWLDKFGDPEIDKKVEIYLDKITKFHEKEWLDMSPEERKITLGKLYKDKDNQK